ncbi:hypothetical protein M2475_000917 [Breznakia sp. PF5-3]|uniref:hypothetical protein n=1 Tax=unclassified Breznakia TaxID=2623764 RepID=UPI00240601D5|nr:MULTISPECIES: hypothetical protein [unclassified Breznakia]MDF9824689.1 hypothetical protein [Breznakia sp. PM6-1]MDF9835352.1 hypothetical protein [Breznakia sp. PF5-3]MDF9836951.1 hypothetical protein [Breznakia sp. PFB2-8]MDF9859587.1 hypothetical protein [Breznakia sp. PH5-24]
MSDITLTNGENLEISINWLTLKLLSDYGLEKLNKKMKSENNQMEVASILIYSILRSNGKKISHEEALSLISVDDDSIFKIFNIFSDKMKAFKKKQEGRIELQKNMK